MALIRHRENNAYTALWLCERRCQSETQLGSLSKDNRPGLGRLVRNTLSAVALCAFVSGCSVVENLRGEPDLSTGHANDAVWGMQQLAELRSEVEDLRKENEALKVTLAETQGEKATIEKRLSEVEARAADAAVPALSSVLRPNAQPAAPANAVVAAAQAKQALADAPPPVQASPRLVQPSFSDDKQVFRNEAAASDIELSSILFGVHLASYRQVNQARDGWRRLQRENPEELGLLEPRLEKVTLESDGDFVRLIGGGFSSQEKASALCERLESKGLYCDVAGFSGDRLTYSEDNGSGS